MPLDNPLTAKYQEVYARLRRGTSSMAGAVWDDLDDYSDAAVLVGAVVPIIESGQAQAAALTDAYLGLAAEVPPTGVTPASIAHRLRGVPLDEVYERPLHTVWYGLSEGREPRQALAAGRSRLLAMADTDISLAMRATAATIGALASNGITRFVRVADGAACELCSSIDGAEYANADAMEMHPSCGCTVEPVVEDSDTFNAEGRSISIQETDTVVHEHGELGPLLANRGDDFREGDDGE